MDWMNSKNKKKELKSWLDLISNKLKHNEEISLTILTGSMSPLLEPGDSVKIKPAQCVCCHIGDIIVFRQGQKLTAHRLIFRFAFGKVCILYQKGDVNRLGNFIQLHQIAGKVTGVIKKNNNKEIYLNKVENRKIAQKQLLKTAFFFLLLIGKKFLLGIKNTLIR